MSPKNAFKHKLKFYDDNYNELMITVCTLFNLTTIYSDMPLYYKDSLFKWVQRTKEILRKNNFQTDQWDPLIIFVIVNAMEPSLQNEWYSFSKEKVLKLGTLKYFLRKMPKVVATGSSPQTATSSTSCACRGRCEPTTPKPSISQQPIDKLTNNCFYCDKSHKIQLNCSALAGLTIKRRIKVLHQNGRCLKCFGKYSKQHQCSMPNCELCGRSHNVRICFRKRKWSLSKWKLRQTIRSMNTVRLRIQMNEILWQLTLWAQSACVLRWIYFLDNSLYERNQIAYSGEQISWWFILWTQFDCVFRWTKLT